MLAEIGKNYFGDIVPALGAVFGIPHLTFDARITGLLSFVTPAGISPQQHQHPPAGRGHRRGLAAPRENALRAVGFLPSVIPAKAGIQRP
jgi:hypothetical protein